MTAITRMWLLVLSFVVMGALALIVVGYRNIAGLTTEIQQQRHFTIVSQCKRDNSVHAGAVARLRAVERRELKVLVPAEAKLFHLSVAQLKPLVLASNKSTLYLVNGLAPMANCEQLAKRYTSGH